MFGRIHVYSSIWLHFNWHCKHDAPLITPHLERDLWEFIESYCNGIKGVHFHAIGGTPTHIHFLTRVEPFVQPSELVRKLKGSSSREMNLRFGSGALHWQRGYGVVSFAELNLPAVRKYVENQKEHHRLVTPLNTTLEKTGYDEEEEEELEGRGGQAG